MNELKILWLDDQREPYRYFAEIEKKRKNGREITGARLRNSTFYRENVFNNYNVSFEWVKNIEEFSSYIESNGLPQFISFDRDLTPKNWMKTHDVPLPDGLACIKWLKQYCKNTNQQLPKCFVHSANAKRIPEMEAELGSAALKQELLKENKRNMKKTIKKSDIKRLVEGIINEIGDTANGQYILGRLASRAYWDDKDYEPEEIQSYAKKNINPSHPSFNKYDSPYDPFEIGSDDEMYDDYGYHMAEPTNETRNYFIKQITESVISKIYQKLNY